MADKLQPPIDQEIAKLTKSDTALADITKIALVAGSYAEAVLPTDNILRTKGGGDVGFYKEVLRDDQVKSTFGQLRLAVVAAPWEVEPGAEDAQSKAAAEALAENLKRIGWDRITDRMLYTLFYGYGVGEVMWQKPSPGQPLVLIENVKVRDRARFMFDVDGKLYLKLSGALFEEMPDRKFWTCSTGADHDDEPYGLGLAHWLYWPVFFKRNDIKFWLIFLEKFGSPTAMATAPAAMLNDPIKKKEVMALLRSIQVDAGVAVPEGVVVELLEAARSGAVDYATLCDKMDAAIAKIVLTQTMTTDDGSSRAQGEVHERKGDKVVSSAADLICESFNNTVAKWFTEYNFAGATPPRVYRNCAPAEDLAARADRDSKIKTLGFEPTEEYVRETYGEGWVKSQQAAAIADALPVPGSAADFAELAALASIKSARRNDQRALLEAAIAFGNKPDEVLGERVRSILAFAEQTGDYETMRAHLDALAAETAPAQTVEKVQRATFMARLLGAFRGQR